MFCSCGFHAFLQVCLLVFFFFLGGRVFHGFGERCSSKLFFLGLVRDGYFFSKGFHGICILFFCGPSLSNAKFPLWERWGRVETL